MDNHTHSPRAGRTAYKVLMDGRSFHGGEMAWSLPAEGPDGSWTPGDWHEVSGDITICETGLHLTREPARWWAKGAVCYEAEYDGTVDDRGGEKFAVERARLLRVVPWSDVNVWEEGEHTISGNGYAVALGSSRVVAWGSSRVVALGSSRVVAWESSRVEARDSSRVVALGSSRVEARDSSSVEARDSSRVEAWDSSRVKARDSSSVEALGSSSVEADGEAVVTSSYDYGGGAPTLRGQAVHIDRRGGMLRLFTAAGEWKLPEPAEVSV